MIIKTGLSYEKYTIVLSGLKAGESYINKGSRSIQNNELVEILIEKD